MCALALIIVGIFQTSAVRRVGTGYPKRSGVPPAAAGPRLPLCPAAGLPMLQPSPLTGHHKVSLSWNASAPSGNSEGKAVGYCLYRSKKEKVAKQSLKKPNARCSDCEQINSVAVAGTGCVDDLVEDGATYHYIATAINVLGNTSSSSEEALAQIPLNKESAIPVSKTSYPFCRAKTGSE